jgi:hypothetical protein
MVCAEFQYGWGYRCLLGCERRSECPQGAACIEVPSHLVTESRGVCDTFGTRTLGELCREELFVAEDPCGPGLTCNGMGEPRCVPACDAYSPHSEDRACPEGMICNTAVSDSTTTRVCLRRCDVASQAGCEEFEVCIRFIHPEEGEIGVCYKPLLFDCSHCAYGTICVEDVCYAPADAPAIPWRMDPDVPPLVD